MLPLLFRPPVYQHGRVIAPRLRSMSFSQLRDLVRFAARRLEEERLPQVAGSLTFATVLGLVPLLTIALAIFTVFPLFNTFRTALETYFSDHLMPKMIANTVLGYLNQFASKSMRLSAVGAVALVLTSVTMMSMIDRVFNRIWRVTIPRPLLQRVLIYWGLVTLAPLLIGISISTTSYLFSATTETVMHGHFLGDLFFSVVSLLLTTGAFTLLYITVPNRAIQWTDACAGGLLAGLVFEAAKRLFALYITKFPTYTIVYGSIAAIPIFLVWIYMFWLVTLVGALFAAALPIVKYERWWHVPAPGSAFVDAMAILKVLFDARSGSLCSAVDAHRVRNRTRLGFDESEALLARMDTAGWVARIKPDTPRRHLRFRLRKRAAHGGDRWTLLANPDQLQLIDIYRIFVFTPSEYDERMMIVEQAVAQGLTQSLTSYFSPTPTTLSPPATPGW